MKKKILNLLLLFVMALLPLSVFAQGMISVSGTVLDQNGDPLIGCTVQLKGSSVGTVTDLDGHFQIKVPEDKMLVFSFIGYKTKEVKAAKTIKVKMEEDSHMLNEVVAIGYGTMKRSDITGSVVSVKAEDMELASAATMDQMLQGRATGLQMTSNSGAAGSGTSIQIRGVNSLSSSNDPVYVIDGSIVTGEAGRDTYTNPLDGLNPNDIESIEILKDASATAIYGAQAANGVIIVNMKKGKEGAPKINFKATAGISNLPKKLDVMDLRQMASYISDLGIAKYSQGYLANPDVLGKGTDWQEALFRTGIKQEYNLSVRGGSKGVNYSVSGGYYTEDGIVINNDFGRFTLRASIDVKAYKWLDLGTTINISHTDNNTGMSTWGVVGNALGMLPNIPVKNEDGTWGKAGYNSETNSWTPNPVAIASITTKLTKKSATRANFYFTIKPWKWLNWRNELIYDVNTENYRYLQPAYDLGGTEREYATHESKKTYNQYMSFKSVATGNWKIASHTFSLMGGLEINDRYRDYLFGQRLGGSDDNLALIGGDGTRDSNDGWTTTQRFSSFFGRLTYNWMDRYLLTATVRHDGSSLFARGQRWGTFPSAALAWKISEEPFFFPLLPTINSLKLRVGYGLVGNANLADNTYQPTFTNMESPFGTGYKTANMPNYDGLTWEKTHSWNLGLDLTLWENRVEFIFDVYKKDTRDLLLQTALPYYTGTQITGGTSAQWANVGSMSNEGLEITLNGTVIRKKNFSWKTGITYSLNKNEITELNSANGFIDKTLDFKTWGGETITRTAVGESVSQYYGYKVAGRINSASDFLRDNGNGTSTVIVATPNYRVGTVVSNSSASDLKTSIGDLLFEDLNGDGVINQSDRTYLGSGLPKFTFGWNNTFTYKRWTLTMFIYGSVGNKVFNFNRRQMDEPSLLSGSVTNKFTRVSNYAKWAYRDGNSGNLNVWNVYVAEGADPTETRIDNNHGNYNSRVSDRYVENADYLRIKNIALSNSFPRNIVKSLMLQSMKFSLNVQNPFTLTGYTGYDPEVGSQNGQYSMSGQGMLMYGVDTGRVPSPRAFIFTLDATF